MFVSFCSTGRSISSLLDRARLAVYAFKLSYAKHFEASYLTDRPENIISFNTVCGQDGIA